MAETLKLGTDGNWATKEGSLLSYNDENGNFKPLPFDFTRASSATVVNKDGLIEIVGSGVPRIDFLNDNNGALLLEPARTNLITYSETLSGNSIANLTLTDNYGTSPEGVQNSTLVEVTSIGQPKIEFLAGDSWSNSTTYTASSFVKQGTGRYVGFGLWSADMGDEFIKWDLTDGTATTQSGISGGAVWSETGFEDFGDGWYRISATITTEAVNSIKSGFKLLAMSAASMNSGVIGETFEYYGAQLEQGSYATSYIPTQGATATRVAESCNNGGNDQVINSTEGVLFVEMAALVNSGTGRVLSISDGTSQNRITIEYYSLPNYIVSRVTSGNVQGAFMVGSTFDQSLNSKFAVRYALNDCAIFINGIKVDFDLSVIMPISLNSLRFDDGSGGSKFEGKIRQIQYFDTALTDQKLIALTS